MQGGVYNITHSILYTYTHIYKYVYMYIYTHALIWLQEPEAVGAVGGLELVHLGEEIYQKCFSGKYLNSKFSSSVGEDFQSSSCGRDWKSYSLFQTPEQQKYRSG